jgi:CYTH domain-containing protein
MEIERKWLVKDMPDLSKISGTLFERYFVFINDGTEIRVQKNGEIYEFERTVKTSQLSNEKEVLEITAAEFNYFKSLTNRAVIRDCYILDTKPAIEVKIYHEVYEGLVRAEVEFATEAAAKAYISPDWFGVEITDNELGMDRKLIQLDRDMFLNALDALK